MIGYNESLFGMQLLARVHGSAVYRAVLPSLLSTAILLIGVYAFNNPIEENSNTPILTHPYAIGVFIAFFTYLITFRANYAYGRYWEGATAIHQMMSKWLDVGMDMAAFHYQGRQYQNVRPPAFGKNPRVLNKTRERERLNRLSQRELKESLEQQEKEEQNGRHPFFAFLRKRRLTPSSSSRHAEREVVKSIHYSPHDEHRMTLPAPKRHSPKKGHRRLATRPSQQFDKMFSLTQLDTGGVETPSLFLQESAHLLSLLSAVAMATLRSDVLDALPPLVEHIPGRPWPPSDPDQLSSVIRKDYHEASRSWTVIRFILGYMRSDKHIMLYNAARPLRVLGGVSDLEMQALLLARGPCAKTALCSKWLEEFISREYMAGSCGGVSPPIISRLYQFISDGMIGYNQCRKISYNPFPFPHAQLTILFIGVVVFMFPLLYYQFVNNIVLACVLNFTTVMCFVGLHEVARELENPFKNVPNDLPLTTFQAQFNEALIAMYAGFHPDAWWVPEEDDVGQEKKTSSAGGKEEAKVRDAEKVQDEAKVQNVAEMAASLLMSARGETAAPKSILKNRGVYDAP